MEMLQTVDDEVSIGQRLLGVPQAWAGYDAPSLPHITDRLPKKHASLLWDGCPATLMHGEIPTSEPGIQPTNGCIHGNLRNDAEVVEWYLHAAERGSPEAQLFLGLSLDLGRGTSRDPLRAFAWYQEGAGNGCAQALFMLGLCLNSGHGHPRDDETAARCYQLAAEQGYARASYKLATCLRLGEGVPRNMTEAMKWCHAAASGGDAESQLELGYCYWHGLGVPMDAGTSLSWYRKAAQQGLKDRALGKCACCTWCDYADLLAWYRIQRGRGLAKARSFFNLSYDANPSGSAEFSGDLDRCREAARHGSASAQFRLGCILDIWNETQEAAKWYRLAADQGHAGAQRNLGACYMHGHGLQQNDEAAFYWLNLAARNGENEAMELRNRIAQRWPPVGGSEAGNPDMRERPVNSPLPRRRTRCAKWTPRFANAVGSLWRKHRDRTRSSASSASLPPARP